MINPFALHMQSHTAVASLYHMQNRVMGSAFLVQTVAYMLLCPLLSFSFSKTIGTIFNSINQKSHIISGII